MLSRIPEVPEKLVEAVVEKKAVLFAGAGVSRGKVQKEEGTVEQYLPGWGDLLTVLLDRAASIGHLKTSEATKLKRAVKEKKYLFVAEAVRKKMGAREYDEALDDIFRNPRLKLTKRHELIAEIPFTAVVTTNYDKLIEAAYSQYKYIPPTYTFDNAPDIISALSHGRFFVLKAHGDIDRKD